MQYSSDRIGALAAALAKAQAEIANPEKSLTATIVSPFPREGSRTFRYASLSSGLELVRKCLGRHEIATVQTTAIDRDSGLIRLATTLVHASGEWVSSDWPVCPVSETAAPHRLGAALTYARRYALFTLVGIAGEDDLDAPDLSPAVGAPPSQNGPSRPEHSGGLLNHPSPSQPASSPLQASQTRARAERVKRPNLAPEASESLRRRLISELDELEGPEALASWAHRALPLKNQLSAGDAQAVEGAFAARLAQLGCVEPVSDPKNRDDNRHGRRPNRADPSPEAVTIIGKPIRERDRDHLRFVATQPCLVCGRTPTDPHHVKFAEQRAISREVSDRFTVPICRLHHRELHRRGDERAWWQKQGIDPLAVASRLWADTHSVVLPEEDVGATGGGPERLNEQRAPVRPQNNETNPIVRPEAS
jgi:ERF superfamily